MVEESGSESPSGGESPTEGELENAKSRITELEQMVAGKEAEITRLKQTGQEMEKRLATLGNSLSEAVASYKTVVVRANPEVIEELIVGDTIASINDSLSRAKELVGKVRRGVESEISLAKVPAGAPERTSPDFSALSPREKIQYAMGRK